MQLNTTTAFATAVLSAAIGFGLAFYIERKLSGGMKKKSQKIFMSMAMVSLGYGLMATINEVIGFPLQGLSVRYDKLAGYVLANIIFLPIVFYAVAKLIGLKSKDVDGAVSVQSNQVGGNFLKYFLIITVAMSIAYIGYAKLEGSSSSAATYDFYTKVDFKNCNSPFEEKPGFSLKFTYKKETNEIFMTAEFSDGKTEKMLNKLDNCSILDAKNWTCGGERIGGSLSPKYMFVDGDFIYAKGIYQADANCDVKIVKR